jgi:hypothetical protein
MNNFLVGLLLAALKDEKVQREIGNFTSRIVTEKLLPLLPLAAAAAAKAVADQIPQLANIADVAQVADGRVDGTARRAHAQGAAGVPLAVAQRLATVGATGDVHVVIDQHGNLRRIK